VAAILACESSGYGYGRDFIRTKTARLRLDVAGCLNSTGKDCLLLILSYCLSIVRELFLSEALMSYHPIWHCCCVCYYENRKNYKTWAKTWLKTHMRRILNMTTSLKHTMQTDIEKYVFIELVLFAKICKCNQ
jgi:hypothetical protein